MKTIILTPDGKRFELDAQQVVVYTDDGNPVSLSTENDAQTIVCAHAAEGKSFNRLCEEHGVYRPRDAVIL